MRVVVGFMPVMPQKAAGARVEPPVSVPIVAAAMSSQIDTALPDDEPPATRPPPWSRPKGLRGLP